MPLTNTLAGHAGKQPSAPTIVLAVDVDFDNSYPTGGEAFDAPALLKSLGKYDKAPTVIGVVIESKLGYVLRYDSTNKKIMAYYADYDAMADGALIQVPDMTSLAALTAVRVLIIAQ